MPLTVAASAISGRAAGGGWYDGQLGAGGCFSGSCALPRLRIGISRDGAVALRRGRRLLLACRHLRLRSGRRSSQRALESRKQLRYLVRSGLGGLGGLGGLYAGRSRSGWCGKAIDRDFVARTLMHSDDGIFVSPRAELSGNQMRLELVSNG